MFPKLNRQSFLHINGFNQDKYAETRVHFTIFKARNLTICKILREIVLNANFASLFIQRDTRLCARIGSLS